MTSPWIYVGIGAVVGGVSWIITASGRGKLGIFIIVGVAMMVYGFVRKYLDRGVSRGRADTRAALEQELPSNKPREYSLHSIPRVCGMCSAKNNPRANFCGHCGSRL